MVLRIERATERDVPLILRLIKALGDYERLSDQVKATETVLREELFGPRPAAEVVIAYADDAPAGFAVFFQNFSTFLGRSGLYLEDLFIVPEWRRRGIGRRLLAHLARVAVERGYGRFEWAVLDWNEPALSFYRSIGARPVEGWTIHRLPGDALARLAALADGEPVG
jgi:GNAT superfamily N-acetyltransferase